LNNLKLIEFIFWLLFLITAVSYFGYGLVVYILSGIKSFFVPNNKNKSLAEDNLPEVTLFVAAYNERDFIESKVNNSLKLNYPESKIKHLWVTDGSDDGTPELLNKYSGFTVLHVPERKGKVSAINRGMKQVTTPIVIFSDCNSMLSVDSVRVIARLFTDPRVGCVSGEKRIQKKSQETASGAGEGLYWNYESIIKRSESKLYSAIGAVGELFSVRTELYSEIPEDTILDDFIISMNIAMAGYRIQYSPDAMATETASVNIQEELVRKVRISAGAFQSVSRLKGLLNPFRYGILSIEYFFHKFLRWIVAPFALLLIIPLNIAIVINSGQENSFYLYFLIIQAVLYLFALTGWIFENYKVKYRFYFLPYYFFVMNLSAYLGLIRYIKGNQSVNWQKARRS